MKKSIIRMLIVTLALGGLILFGCQKKEEEKPAEKAAPSAEKTMAPKEKGKVELAYVEWASEVASTNVVRAVLQEKMGYEVELTPVSAAAMWTAVGTGDVDGMVAGWLPTTHGHYLERVKDQVESLGPNLEGTRIGLVVPAYVTIASIPELKDNAEKFDSKIIGIDPGAGIMSKTEKAIDEYGLENFSLVEGSGATMTAALSDAIRHDQWIVVTGWTPHWMFAKWDLKYLEDPKDVFGGEEHINTIVRKGLKEDMPEVYQFLDNFHWTPEDMQQVMVWNQEKEASPYENAKKWIEENPDKVQAWLPK